MVDMTEIQEEFFPLASVIELFRQIIRTYFSLKRFNDLPQDRIPALKTDPHSVGVNKIVAD